MFRSLVLVAAAILHIIVGVVLVQKMGLIGVAIGSAVAVLIGSNIIMNVYYQKRIGLQVVRMIREIFS